MTKNKRHTWESMYIELTSKCNLNCAYCYNNCSNNTIDYLPVDVVKNLIDKAHILQINDISFSGGEPLLHPNFMEIFDYYTSVFGKGPTLITNASLLTDNLLEKIVSTKTLLQLTIDGDTADIHGLTRDFSNFSNNIHVLDILQNKYHYTGIFGRMNLTFLNYKRIIPTAKLLIDKGVHNLTFALISTAGRGANFNNSHNIYESDILEIIKHDLDYLTNLYTDTRFRYLDLANCLGCDFNSNKEHHINLRIRYDGIIFPCQAFCSDCYKLGNCLTTDLTDASFISIYDQWIENALSKKENAINCENCFCHTFCRGGCLAHIIDNEDRKIFNAACIMRKNKYKDLLLKQNKRI